LGQHASMRLARNNIMPVQATIEANRLREGFDAIVGRRGEPASPALVAHGAARGERIRNEAPPHDSGGPQAQQCSPLAVSRSLDNAPARNNTRVTAPAP